MSEYVPPLERVKGIAHERMNAVDDTGYTRSLNKLNLVESWLSIELIDSLNRIHFDLERIASAVEGIERKEAQ